MSDLKTKPTKASVAKFISAIEDDQQRADCKALAKIMRKVTGNAPKMWGDSIVGFGSYHYVYASGQQGDWPLTGFSPRKRNLSLYIMSGFSGQSKLMKKLGKHRTGKACLYINKLADVDVDVLAELIERSVEHVRATYS